MAPRIGGGLIICPEDPVLVNRIRAPRPDVPAVPTMRRASNTAGASSAPELLCLRLSTARFHRASLTLKPTKPRLGRVTSWEVNPLKDTPYTAFLSMLTDAESWPIYWTVITI